MNKKYQNLIAGTTDGIDITESRTRRELFEAMVTDLQGNAEENKRGIAALQNWEKMDTPSEPPAAPNTPEKDLSLSVREGEIPVTDLSKDLYKTATGVEFPGTGERSDKEITNEDVWDGFESAEFQTGKEPKGMDKAILEENGGRKEVDAFAEARSIQNYGPARLVEGALTGDFSKMALGMKECDKMAMDGKKILGDAFGDKQGNILMKTIGASMDTMTRMNPLMKGPTKLLETIVGAAFGGEKDKDPREKNTASFPDQLTNAIGKMVEQFTEKVGRMGLINTVTPLTPEGNPKKQEEQKEEEPGKKPEVAGGDMESMLDLCKKLSAGVAYKKCRKAGMKSEMAGMVAEEAGEATQEINSKAKDGKELESPLQKGLEKGASLLEKGAEIAKDFAVKAVTKGLAAIPVVGPFLAVGFVVANKLADVAIDAAKEGLSKGLGDLTGTTPGKDQEMGEDTGFKAGDVMGSQGQHPRKEAVKDALKKGKDSLKKLFVPDGDVAGAIIGQGAKTVTGGIASLDSNKTKKPPEELGGINQ